MSSWRPEDERLLRALEDETAIQALHRFQAPPRAPALPMRARVLARELRALEGGPAAVSEAATGNAQSLSRLLGSLRLADQRPELLHAISTYFRRLAESNFDGDADAHAAAWKRAMAAWFRLATAHDHLESFLGESIGMDPPAAASLAHALIHWPIERLEEEAASDVLRLAERGRRAYQVLGMVDEACNLAAIEGTSQQTLQRRAQMARDHALEIFFAACDNELDEISSKHDDPFRTASVFARLFELWRWSGHDMHVENYACERVTPQCWALYRKTRWEDIKALLHPFLPMYESLEARIVGAPLDMVAHSAAAAQIFVFLSEAEPNPQLEWGYAERAIGLCPGHRNARVVKAHLLANRAIAELERATLFDAGKLMQSAEKHISEAEALFPEGKRLKVAKSKLSEVRARWPGRG